MKHLPDCLPQCHNHSTDCKSSWQREETESRQRVEESIYYILNGSSSRVVPHSSLGSLSPAVVVSPGTEWQEGASTEHTRENSVWLLREASGFVNTQLGFFRNCSCISGERLCNAE